MAVRPRAVSPLLSFWRLALSFWQEPTADTVYVVIQRDWVGAVMWRRNLFRERLRDARDATFSVYSIWCARSSPGTGRLRAERALGTMQRDWREKVPWREKVLGAF